MSAVVQPARGEGAATVDEREAAVCALLVARGRLKDGDLVRARRLHEEATEGTLTALLARLGLVNERELALLMADPADPYPLQAVTLAAGRPVALRIGLRSEIDDLIERYYGSGRSAMGTIVENIDGGASEVDDVEHL